MVVDVSSVPRGTTLNDLTHKGIRQGGNKSTLAYRNDIGIPGYTGFNPSSACLLPDPKGSTVHTGKVADRDSRIRSTMVKNDQHTTSQYNHVHGPISPGEYKPPSMHGNTYHQTGEGGYWIERASLPGPPKPFLASSTYKNEMLNAQKEMERAMSKTDGLSITTCCYSAGVRRSTSGAASMRDVRSAPAATTTSMGDTIGYKTCYSSMVLKDPLTGGGVAAGAPRMPSQKPSQRARVLPHSMPSGLQKTTMYRNNFGCYGEEPLTKMAIGKEDMTLSASTNDINKGTSRTTRHIPGYGGFIPESANQQRAVEHGYGAVPRQSEKVDMLLYSLDQYSRERMPKYQGSRPQANRNIQLDEQPTTATTQGNANHLTLRIPRKPVDKSLYSNTNEGVGSFFTDGGTFKSDNGKAEADRYYIGLRPIEGHPSMRYPDKRTAYGGKFTNPW